ncbi:MAG: DUF4861 family protein, partial [Pirellulales bacterium]
GVIDYQDNDGDGDVDEMGVYFGEYQKPWIDKNKIKVWWSRDVGDDNLLWYDVDWNYHQIGCQYRTHFSGDEVFYQFALTKDSKEWLNVFEDPFAFYDPDGDGCSEVVMRICAIGRDVSSLRYSIDIDNDAHGRHTHDYDFSITALPGDHTITTDDTLSESFRLRGIPVHPVLTWQNARKFARHASWARALLIWDEMNANTEEDVTSDPHERWEGIINHAADDFPQVGGPACSPLNKRYELADPPSRPLRLYYDVTDHRLHLLGAHKGWLHMDADLDGQVDARYEYRDDDDDGIFDRRLLDLDADGQIDFDWKMQGKDVARFDLEYGQLHAAYRTALEKTLKESQAFIDQAKAALGDNTHDPAEAFFLTKLETWTPETRLGERMRTTPAGARFYIDLIRDRLFLALSKRFGDHARWQALTTAYQAGDYRAAAGILEEELKNEPSRSASPKPFRSYRRRIPIQLDNRGKPQRDDWPVVLAVKEIQKIASDFSPDRCAIVPSPRWIDWRPIPHQVDTIDPTVGSEISFLAQVPEDATATYYLYYAPTSDRAVSFPRRTGTADDWLPPNIGWESNRCAYRAYWGQFDFFGKKSDHLIYGDIEGENYHRETEWGIDALHVGKTSGLGGLTLYVDDRAWPVQNPAGDGDVVFSKRILTQGPIRSAIEIVANNVIRKSKGPSQDQETPSPNPSPASGGGGFGTGSKNLAVRILCIIYADHQETEIRARVTGADRDATLAPGMVQLPREQTFDDAAAGCFGTWGWQEDAIGEIGMGIVVSPRAVIRVRDQPAERQIECRISDGGKLRYWIIGDWRRGRQYPVAPTVDNWKDELQDLAHLLLDDVNIKLGRSQDTQ